MTDCPIIFSAPMILALLAGRKTQTRRMANTEKRWTEVAPGTLANPQRGATDCMRLVASPWRKVQPGDRLWVREAFAVIEGGAVYDGAGNTEDYVEPHVRYCADGPTLAARWKPSIHMPRWASRLTLTVTDVRVQRLQEISEEDAIAEGVRSRGTMPGAPYDHFDVPGLPIRTEHDPIPVFISLWSHIHGPGAWDANPEVVALTFSVEQRNIDAIGRAA